MREDIDRIKKLESEIKLLDSHTGPGRNNEKLTGLLHEVVKEYANFFDKYPGSGESAEYLFRSGEIHLYQLLDPESAVLLFNKVYINFPGSEIAPKAIFLKGWVYHYKLGKLIEAKAVYEELINKFPGHELSREAKGELHVLGIGPDSLLKDILRKGRKDRFGLEEK